MVIAPGKGYTAMVADIVFVTEQTVAAGLALPRID
jgi:hypothetical protein